VGRRMVRPVGPGSSVRDPCCFAQPVAHVVDTDWMAREARRPPCCRTEDGNSDGNGLSMRRHEPILFGEHDRLREDIVLSTHGRPQLCSADTFDNAARAAASRRYSWCNPPKIAVAAR
jgi:hypothetical protein